MVDAFDVMNSATNDDMYVTGGSLIVSEYEHNMSPQDQDNYERLLMYRFQMAYDRDPYKQNLDFDHWLKTLNPELYRERAAKYDDIVDQNYGFYKLKGMDPLEGALIEDAGILQGLAHIHTGRIEDLIRIVEDMDSGGMDFEIKEAWEEAGRSGRQIIDAQP